MLGRFDKNKFDLLVSVLVGGNGGMYGLMNSLPDSNLDSDFYEEVNKLIEESLGKEYLNDKMKGNKIILGKGSFGTVKIGLSLTENISKPCDLICIKKSKKI